jgi:hypothetical protein
VRARPIPGASAQRIIVCLAARFPAAFALSWRPCDSCWSGSSPSAWVAVLGESTHTGWRGAVGNAVAKPVAKRTRFTEEQIRVALGLALLA